MLLLFSIRVADRPTSWLGESCSFALPHVSFVIIRQFCVFFFPFWFSGLDCFNSRLFPFLLSIFSTTLDNGQRSLDRCLNIDFITTEMSPIFQHNKGCHAFTVILCTRQSPSRLK